MATSADVLTMLCPAGGWIITNEDFETIVWVDDRPRCTKKQFTDGFAQFDAWVAQQEATKAAEKTALLARLGITDDEAKLLLS